MVGSHEIHHRLDVHGLAAGFAATGLPALGPSVPGTTVLIAACVLGASVNSPAGGGA